MPDVSDVLDVVPEAALVDVVDRAVVGDVVADELEVGLFEQAAKAKAQTGRIKRPSTAYAGLWAWRSVRRRQIHMGVVQGAFVPPESPRPRSQARAGRRPDHRGALHRAALGPVVARGVVLHGPVVPERHRILGPGEAALVLGGIGLTAQPIEQRQAGLAVQSLNVAHEGAVDVEVQSPGGRVRAHHGMTHRRVLLLGLPCVPRLTSNARTSG